MRYGQSSKKSQREPSVAGGLVDPRDLNSDSGEPLPLPDEPATEPRDDDEEATSGEQSHSPARGIRGIVDPRLIGSDPTGIAPPEDAQPKQDGEE